MVDKVIISILIPTYNRTEFLRECLESALAQEGFNKFELAFIISDNSENDKTKLLVESYINENSHLNILYNKNIPSTGPVKNFNTLLELKKGKYFIFLSDDDLFHDKNSLRSLYDAIIVNNADLSYGNNVSFNKLVIKKNRRGYQTNSKLIFKEHIIGFGGTLYKDYGFRYDQSSSLYVDYDFNVNYVLHKKTIYIDYNTVMYRLHEGQSIHSISSLDDRKMKLYIFNKYCAYRYNMFAYIRLIFEYFIYCLNNKSFKIGK